ncbi:hypothetical protein O6H91_16G014300 [Diphasiastrum complanatum]|uniref:Uncharacterized protein n=2 Tax=Diphasiastrum complanatum TaxID=34168 RepID=A0ACC2B9W9_DIPCM|nr:hypothetical protein O6H91_16G011100 [Diphasiastrum complanatum]KAJ7526607.1 hypothetical protein O6H91_16G014300 [Diphasiastrum complanatum]
MAEEQVIPPAQGAIPAEISSAFAMAPERFPSVGRRSGHYNKCCPVEQCIAEKGLFNDLPMDFAPCASLSKKVGAEFIGTFMLIFAGTATAIVNEKTDGSITSIGLAATSGLAVMIVILSTGHISGAHLNPSLTLSFAALRHFPWVQVPFYIGAQVAASICASFALKGIFNPDLHGGVTIPAGSYWQSFVLEFVISFNLMFVVTAVATDTRAVGELAGIAVGATVTLNILVAGAISGGSMNPVRTLGPAIAANNYKGIWLYIVGCPLGALAGAAAYTLVRLNGEEPIQAVRSLRR